MSENNIVTFTTPVGRIVSGDVYRGRDKDQEGRPLVIKNGPNAGQPRVDFYVGLAIPKKPNVPWEQEEWGQKIMGVAREMFPTVFDPATGHLFQGRQFAFKVSDGDSVTPNTVNRRPCDNEGWSGHWVLHFSNGFAPKCYNSDGTAPLMEPLIKRGHYVQVNGSIKGNGSAQQAGIFLNHNMIAHSGYGPEIITGPDPLSVGFGGQALPAGASAVPVGAMATESPGQQSVQQPVQQTAPPPPPATDLIQPPPPPPTTVEKYEYNNSVYTKEQLLAMPGWTEAHLATLQKV